MTSPAAKPTFHPEIIDPDTAIKVLQAKGVPVLAGDTILKA